MSSPPPRADSIKDMEVEEWAHRVNEYPDGGATAWLAVAGATACLFVSFGWINAIGIFQEYYHSNQLHDYTPSAIAWIPSLQSMSPPPRCTVPPTRYFRGSLVLISL